MGRRGQGGGRRSGPGHQLLDLLGSLRLVQASAEEDVLPPERKEEFEVHRVYCAGQLCCRQGGGGAGDGCGQRGAVGGYGVLLRLATVGHLRAAPGIGPLSAELKEESAAAGGVGNGVGGVGV